MEFKKGDKVKVNKNYPEGIDNLIGKVGIVAVVEEVLPYPYKVEFEGIVGGMLFIADELEKVK